ncbi:MAG: rod shape-determining protein MreC [Acidobacteriota bacterium]
MIDIRRRTTYFFLLVSLGHVLLISAQVQSKSGMPLLEHVAFSAFAGIQRLSASVADGAWSLWGRYVALHGVVADNVQLRAEITTLQGELQQKDALAARTRSLEAALQLQPTVSGRTIAARVIAGDPTPGAFIITIDRGTDDGLRENMGVIAPGGVVGRIMVGLTPKAARVQLLVGRNAGAGALLERVAAEGVVTGGGDDPPLRMQFVNKSYDVAAGDRVVTSGHDGLFPAGFVIGTVSRVARGGGLYLQVDVRPAVNFSHLDVVLVLLDAPASGGGTE